MIEVCAFDYEIVVLCVQLRRSKLKPIIFRFSDWWNELGGLTIHKNVVRLKFNASFKGDELNRIFRITGLRQIKINQSCLAWRECAKTKPKSEFAKQLLIGKSWSKSLFATWFLPKWERFASSEKSNPLPNIMLKIAQRQLEVCLKVRLEGNCKWQLLCFLVINCWIYDRFVEKWTHHGIAVVTLLFNFARNLQQRVMDNVIICLSEKLKLSL